MVQLFTDHRRRERERERERVEDGERGARPTDRKAHTHKRTEGENGNISQADRDKWKRKGWKEGTENVRRSALHMHLHGSKGARTRSSTQTFHVPLLFFSRPRPRPRMLLKTLEGKARSVSAAHAGSGDRRRGKTLREESGCEC